MSFKKFHENKPVFFNRLRERARACTVHTCMPCCVDESVNFSSSNQWVINCGYGNE